jgi:hypothetical protein
MKKYNPELPLYIVYIPNKTTNEHHTKIISHFAEINMQIIPVYHNSDYIKFECVHEGFKMLEVKEKMPIFAYENISDLISELKKHKRKIRVNKIIEKI